MYQLCYNAKVIQYRLMRLCAQMRHWKSAVVPRITEFKNKSLRYSMMLRRLSQVAQDQRCSVAEHVTAYKLKSELYEQLCRRTDGLRQSLALYYSLTKKVHVQRKVLMHLQQVIG